MECASPAFDWISIVVIPVLISMIVGVLAGIISGRYLLYQQTLSTAICHTLEIQTLTTTGEFKDAVVGCRMIHARIRGSALALELQGHGEAAMRLGSICEDLENDIGGVITEGKSIFQGDETDEDRIDVLSTLFTNRALQGARAIASIRTPLPRFLSFRQRVPEQKIDTGS